MRVVATAILGALALPAFACAAQTASAGRIIDTATQLPDTTYRVVVKSVNDQTHMVVIFADGREGTLTAGRPNMVFASIHPGDTVMLSTARGTVLVFKDYGAQPAPASPTATP